MSPSVDELLSYFRVKGAKFFRHGIPHAATQTECTWEILALLELLDMQRSASGAAVAARGEPYEVHPACQNEDVDVGVALKWADRLSPPNHPKGRVLYVPDSSDADTRTKLALDSADALGILAAAYRQALLQLAAASVPPAYAEPPPKLAGPLANELWALRQALWAYSEANSRLEAQVKQLLQAGRAFREVVRSVFESQEVEATTINDPREPNLSIYETWVRSLQGGV